MAAKKEWRQWQQIGVPDAQILTEKRKWFRKIEQCLDKGEYGANWLEDDRIAKVVWESLLYRHEKQFDLDCFCIMPNHVHLIFRHFIKEQVRPDADFLRQSLQGIQHSWKRFTARKGNQILGRKGSFWARESFDHMIRNPESYVKLVNYVLQNPVKAGLEKTWQAWPWTWLNPKWKARIIEESDNRTQS